MEERSEEHKGHNMGDRVRTTPGLLTLLFKESPSKLQYYLPYCFGPEGCKV